MMQDTPARDMFSAPLEIVPISGVLFDMDGTLIDSTPAIEKYWHAVGEDLGVDANQIMRESHGRRSIDTLKLFDPKLANWDYVHKMEGMVPYKYGQDAQEIPGAKQLLSSMESANVPWAIVTSGSRPLITGWLEVMKLAQPKNLVTAEDVKIGKPDPECYNRGKEHLKLSKTAGKDIIVVEDSPAGIRAGLAASCKVIGLATSHSLDRVIAARPTWIVKDLSSVKYVTDGTHHGHALEIDNALVPGQTEQVSQNTIKDLGKRKTQIDFNAS